MSVWSHRCNSMRGVAFSCAKYTSRRAIEAATMARSANRRRWVAGFSECAGWRILRARDTRVQGPALTLGKDPRCFQLGAVGPQETRRDEVLTRRKRSDRER